MLDLEQRSGVIAAARDVRVMSQGKIGLAELSVGVPFPPSAMEILRHVIGPAAWPYSLRRRSRILVWAGPASAGEDVGEDQTCSCRKVANASA